jgi:hypothetical protein
MYSKENKFVMKKIAYHLLVAIAVTAAFADYIKKPAPNPRVSLMPVGTISSDPLADAPEATDSREVVLSIDMISGFNPERLEFSSSTDLQNRVPANISIENLTVSDGQYHLNLGSPEGKLFFNDIYLSKGEIPE